MSNVAVNQTPNAGERKAREVAEAARETQWTRPSFAKGLYLGAFDVGLIHPYPEPDPAMFGLPPQDDGSRDDPLLSGAAEAVTAYRPDVAALTAASTRVVVAAGIESRDLLTWRTSAALAASLGQDLTVFPSHHAGFVGPGFGQPGEPEAFAARLREVLAGTEG